MNETNVGNKFDPPCEDNVAFAVAKNRFDRSEEQGEGGIGMGGPTGAEAGETGTWESGYTIDDFLEEFNTGGTDFTSLPSSIAMHQPIYPKVLGNRSEPIHFSLTPDLDTKIQTATLRIKVSQVNPSDLLGLSGNYSYPDVSLSPDFTVSWRIRDDGRYDMDDGNGSRVVYAILFNTEISGITTGAVTFVKYEFVANYLGEGSETSEISFALQNFHELMAEFPAPIYAQGSLDLIDIVFIPAKDHNQLEDVDQAEIIKASDYLIREAFFNEPVIKFHSKEFNFWINKKVGRAKDYNLCRNGCSHEGPGNLGTTIRQEMELKALLHKTFQRDFTDGTDLFSVSIERSESYHFFLHELGHVAFDLADEYKDGWHHEEREKNFPNNWRRIRSAKADAVLRHKQPEDARRIR